MNIQQFPTGQIVKSPKGYNAFVPHSLPPKLEWDNAVVNSLSRADFLLGKLAREGSQLPNPHLLMRPFITRETVLSSKIEGTQATLGEILAANAGAHVKQNPDDLEEVQNYIKKTNDNKRDKVYCATAILNILEEPTKIRADVYE